MAHNVMDMQYTKVIYDIIINWLISWYEELPNT